ncbi:multidrug resistance-associated protein 1 [Elysia marginata]|uniref:Multidrug resistance-associated protein 1 n=1 Tax=Elysia marginata TaxID=1093978 RepID=A0AAV4GED7_9GAST|nr:multidrug resistance-associated protein 1 [Elysia marginata]
MKNATFTWDTATKPLLQNINLTIPQGKLIAVVGPVGAGKSSLLSAMLKDMEQMKCRCSITGRVAYVPQQAWVLNKTLRDNILLEEPLHEALYHHVVWACALEADIELLAGGDMAEIGEKACNL